MIARNRLTCRGQVTLFDVESRRFLGELLGHTNRITAVQLSGYESLPNGALTAAVDRTVRVWDTQTLQCLHSHSAHSAEVFCAAYRDEGQAVSGDKARPMCSRAR